MSVLNPTINKRKSKAKAKDEGQPGGAFGSLRLLGRFMLGQRGLFFMSSLMLIFEAYTAVQIPLLTAYVINYLEKRLEQLRGIEVLPPSSPMELIGLPNFVNKDFTTLIIITAGFIFLTMINSLADSLSEIYLARGGRRLGYNLRVGLYSHLQKLSLAFHDQRRTGDILTRVTSDVAAIEDFIISSLSDFLGSVLLIGFIIYVMLTRAPEVALIAAVIIPVMALVSNYFTKRIKSASKKLRASEGELASAAQEMLTSIRVIQTYGLGSYEQGMFANQSKKAMNSALESAGLQARFSWIVSVLGAISMAAVIWIIFYIVFRDPIVADIGMVAAYVAYIKDMFKPTKRIIQEWNTLAKLYASLDRIADLLDRKPAVQDLPGAVPAPPLRGNLEFRNVAFAYTPIPTGDGEVTGPPKLALKNLSFDIDAGKVIAIVGHTGAGKSTIVQLIPRLYDPLEGQVLIDGHDIREFTLDSLRTQMSMVLQETILFTGSIVENIAYGRTDATWAEIIAAAKQANAHEFIEKLPEGYYTRLGERGSNLSGGQRQRLAIARAFIRNSPVLILDEPSTGLDAESTELVLKALRTLMLGKTTVIISHDLNLIRHADKIVVIKDGEVEQVGTHESLLEAGGLYANLYMKQYGPVEVKPAAVPDFSTVATVVGLRVLEQPQDGETAVAEPEIVYLDLPNSPSMLSRVPALKIAFDGKSMQEILQPVLFSKENTDYIIESCRPGKALYLPEDIVNMQYDLKVSGIVPDEKCTFIINARLFPTIDECERYRTEVLAPLLAQMRSRPEITPFENPVAVLEELKMAVSVFPIDGMLPTLLGATDCDRMIKVFSNTLPEVLSNNFTVNNMRFEVVHYGRYQRCVLKYVLEGLGEDGSSFYERVVFGKVDSDGYSALTIPVMGALMEHMGWRRLYNYNFRIPRPLGFVPDLNLLLMEALPGNVRLKDLLQDRLCGAGIELPGDLTLEEALESCAHMLMVLHTSQIQLGRRRNFEDEITMVSAEVETMERVFPSLGGQLHSWLDEAIAFGRTTEPMMPVFSHGDFTYSQLIFQGKESGLVDFDSICQAEPGLDLGQFLAYQRLVICKEQNPEAPMDSAEVERLSELFLSTYIAHSDWLADESLLRQRTMAYEIISLIRLAVHSWDKLKGTRLTHTINILKERISCLSQVS